MSYQSRIREIQSAFTLGFEDRETCISMFETLLHEYGLLPVMNQLDRAITNENFLALLKAAKDHMGVSETPLPISENLKHLELAEAKEELRKFAQWVEKMSRGADQRYRIADSVNHRCPVCQKPTNSLFNRIRNRDHEEIPVDPPRCQTCMLKWVQERYGVPATEASAPLPTTEDGSPVSPLRMDEIDFFAEYERQMEKP
jgi:hypothetical protein